MKTLLSILLLSMVIGLAGCKKCATCFKPGACFKCTETKNNFPDFEICTANFPDVGEYNDLVNRYKQKSNYTCKERAARDEFKSCNASETNQLRLLDYYRCVY